MKTKPPTKPKPKPKPRPLSVRQERFCELIAAGRSGTDAWIQAGYNVSRTTAAQNAAESLRKPNIAGRVAVLRLPVTKKLLLSKDRQREILRDIAESASESTLARIRAIEADAKLAGYFAPDKLVVDAGPNTLDAIRERARQMSSPLDRNGRSVIQKP